MESEPFFPSLQLPEYLTRNRSNFISLSTTKRARSALVLLVLLPPFAIVKGQAAVQVMADQPEKPEVIGANDLFTLTDNSIIFGLGITLSGGSVPFSYTWFRDDQMLDKLLHGSAHANSSR